MSEMLSDMYVQAINKRHMKIYLNPLIVETSGFLPTDLIHYLIETIFNNNNWAS